MKILVFDNYDSFTYNLVHLVEKIIHQKVDVYRNDQISLEKVKAYDKIILSPGPGIPVEAGMLLPLIKEYAPSKSILGVCLGHQAIGESFGCKLVNLRTVYHGVATPVYLVKEESAFVKKQGISVGKREMEAARNDDSGFLSHFPRNRIFENFPDQLEAGRYHSWIVSEENFPADLEITARDANNYIMAMQHKKFDVQCVQFHPESVLTPMGEQIMRNWLKN